MKDWKRAINIVLIAFFLCLVAYYGTYCAPLAAPEPVAERLPAEVTSYVFRLHILAHSDREEDQAAKLAARDIVLTEFFTRFNALITCDQAIEYVGQRSARLHDKISAALTRRGLAYGVQVKIVEEQFPVTYYSEICLPAGQYRSLHITLGEGKGRNWWCVLYPPLCFGDLNDGEAVMVMAEEERGAAAGRRPRASWAYLRENWREELKKIIIAQ